MSLVAHVGTSALDEAAAAGHEAATGALAGLAGRPPAVAVVFATADYDQPALLAGIAAAMPGTPLVGCSGEGIIAGDDSVEEGRAVSVLAVAADRIRFETCLLDGYADDPVGVGRRLAAFVNDRSDARCLCVMPDGLAGNCTEFLNALHGSLCAPLPIAGGAAADSMVFERTFQYGDGRVTSGGVAALLVCGEADIEVAVSHGCTPIGLERVVTRSGDGWIREIDGQPAWTLFKEYLDDDVDDLNMEGIAHLCIGEPLRGPAPGYDPYVIRVPMQLDKATGALFFPGGGLTEGRTIQLTRRDPERIRQSAQQCAAQVLSSRHDQSPAVVLQFDCAGRGQVLWGHCAAGEVVEPLRRTLGPTTPWIGFHSYGEIAPIGGQPYYHNYTVALCAIYERDDTTRG